jgi:hypothetical protein
MSATTNDELIACLWAWAKGYLPYEAAVLFARDTGSIRVGHPLIEEDPDAPGFAAFNFDGDWEARIGHASGGERATWRLIQSMAHGLLGDDFGRLDRGRKVAFLNSMLLAWMQVSPSEPPAETPTDDEWWDAIK